MSLWSFLFGKKTVSAPSILSVDDVRGRRKRVQDSPMLRIDAIVREEIRLKTENLASRPDGGAGWGFPVVFSNEFTPEQLKAYTSSAECAALKQYMYRLGWTNFEARYQPSWSSNKEVRIDFLSRMLADEMDRERRRVAAELRLA